MKKYVSDLISYNLYLGDRIYLTNRTISRFRSICLNLCDRVFHTNTSHDPSPNSTQRKRPHQTPVIQRDFCVRNRTHPDLSALPALTQRHYRLTTCFYYLLYRDQTVVSIQIQRGFTRKKSLTQWTCHLGRSESVGLVR